MRIRKLDTTEKAAILTAAKLPPCDCGTDNTWAVADEVCWITPDAVRVHNPDIVRRLSGFALVSCPSCRRAHWFHAPTEPPAQ